jgi:hypothetical protein
MRHRAGGSPSASLCEDRVPPETLLADSNLPAALPPASRATQSGSRHATTKRRGCAAVAAGELEMASRGQNEATVRHGSISAKAVGGGAAAKRPRYFWSCAIRGTDCSESQKAPGIRDAGLAKLFE